MTPDPVRASRSRRPAITRLPGLQRLLAYASAPAGHLRSHRQIVATWPEAGVKLGPDVAVVCHYDPRGVVREDLLYQLAALRAAELSVVLVSNSVALDPADMSRLRALCAAILLRHNVGRDFCAWRDAMEWLALPRTDTRQLVLANDSVYGPLHALAPLLARMDGGADLWGMTDSRQRGYHLQSYFLLARQNVLHSTAWRRFWRGVRPLPAKWLVIGRYEIGLTRRLRRAGLVCRALFAATDTAGEPTDCNPMLECWRALAEAGLPFIKRELLRDNPLDAPDLAAWRDVVTRIAGPQMRQAIERDLAVARNVKR